MALTFNLAQTHELRYALEPETTGFTMDPNATYGYRFTVSEACTITAVGWLTSTTILTFHMAIWEGSSTVYTQKIDVTGSSAKRVPLPTPISLVPGVTYTFGYAVSSSVSTSWHDGQTPNPAPPYPIATILPVYDNKAEDGYPITTSTPPPDVNDEFRGFPVLYLTLSRVDSVEEPPEPIIFKGVRAFSVAFPPSAITYQFKEWDLQYARSTDGTTYGDWIDLGTFSYSTPSFAHNNLEITTTTYYRYRYRIRTNEQQSEWSEVGIAGAAQLSSTPVTPGSIGPDEIADSAIEPQHISTGSVGTTAIQNSAIKPSHLSVSGTDNFTFPADLIATDQLGVGTNPAAGYKIDAAGKIRSSTGGFEFPDGTTQTTAAAGSAKPVAKIRRTTALSISNNTTTTVTGLSTVDFDNDSMTTTADRITIVTTGMYRIAAHILWAGNVTGSRLLNIIDSGGGAYAGQIVPANPEASIGTRSTCTELVELTAGDYLRLQVRQGSGVALNLTTAALSVEYVGPHA